MSQVKLQVQDYTCLVCGASMHVRQLVPSEDGKSLVCPNCHGPGGYLVHVDEIRDLEAYASIRRHPLSLLEGWRKDLKVKPTPEIRILTRKMIKIAMDAEGCA